MTTANFLEQMRIKAESKAIQMAALELANWNNRHEAELIQNFGFMPATVADRKANLQTITTR
jgi:hypothetical protein